MDKRTVDRLWRLFCRYKIEGTKAACMRAARAIMKEGVDVFLINGAHIGSYTEFVITINEARTLKDSETVKEVDADVNA